MANSVCGKWKTTVVFMPEFQQVRLANSIPAFKALLKTVFRGQNLKNPAK
jgi:hypothetical protein